MAAVTNLVLSLPLIAAVLITTTIVTVQGQNVPGFTLRGQSYPNHGLVLINDIGETEADLDPNNGLNCVSDLSDCCSAGERGEFDFPDGSMVPTLGGIRNGYYRNRAMDRNILNRRQDGTVQGLFTCRIRTQASPTEYQRFYIGVYDEQSGIAAVSGVSSSGPNLTCTSTGGPATRVTWRRNCAILPNNAMYQQSQQVTQTQTATYQNTLIIDDAVTERDGVYTCSVTNARGYSSDATGLGAEYDPLPVTVTITSTTPVANGSLTLTCDHASTAMNPAYQWFDESGVSVGTDATLTFNPLLESDSGEYSCLVTDQMRNLVGCGVERVMVQAPALTVSVEGVTGAIAGTSQTLTCSVRGVDLGAAAVTSVSYTWLRDGSVVQSASTSNQYTIASGSVGVSNAGDVYTCQVAAAASYWDVSGSFGGSGSGTLTVIISTPSIQFTRTPLVPNYYIGLNFIWRCDVRIPGSQLFGVDAVVEWMGPNGKLSSSSDSRLTIGDLVVDSPGREYRRSLTFSPLSANDMGSYSCSATVMPSVENSKVTDGVGTGNDSLNVASPTLDVSIERSSVSPRILDLPSFNGFTLTCMASSRVAGSLTDIRKRITWTRTVNGGTSEQLTDGANSNDLVMIMEDDLFQATSMSVLTVNTTVSGSHVYNCSAELVVSPAPDVIAAQDQTTVSIAGASLPVTPTGLTAIDITHNSAIIRWTISSLSYDPEVYVVQYGLAQDNLSMTSAIVTGALTPLNYMNSVQEMVELTGLDRLTTYYYRVMATNSNGPTFSAVGTFNTSALAPDPPTMLQCSQVPDDPLSYMCSWMAPAVTNGVLAGYELTCVPQLEGIASPPAVSPSTTSANVSSLRNGVNYTCSVRARNEGGLSLASDPTSFYTTEIAPTGMPLELMVLAINSREMQFTWSPPEVTMRNGIITGYSLTCSITATGMGQISGTYPPQPTYRLSGFRPGTQYTCQVVAMNSAGSGPPAVAMPTSPEDVPDAPPQDIEFRLTNVPQEIVFSWNPPPEEKRNGIIQSYRISCVDIQRVREPITEIATGVLPQLVAEFVPATLYNCSLSARTSAGFGVNSTVQVLTMPDRPGILQVTTEARSLLAMWTYSNPPLSEGALINGYRVYISSSKYRLNRSTTGTQLTVTGLTPFTNYTVEVSAYNTRRDGVIQEGPRSVPVTSMTEEDVPSSPLCPTRWEVASLNSLVVNWTIPPQPNGIITGYYVQLFSFNNDTMIESAVLQDDLIRLRTDLNNLRLVTGVPYHIRVFAENGAGNGSFCTISDFGDEAIPGNELARSINITRINEGMAARLIWLVLSLDRVGCYAVFWIEFSQNGVVKRQTGDEEVVCAASGCRVPYQQGRVTVTGLDPSQPVTFSITAVNEDGEQGATETQTFQPFTSPSTGPPPSHGGDLPFFVYIVIGVAVVLLMVAIIVIIIVMVVMSRRKKQSSRLYSPKHMSGLSSSKHMSARNPGTELDELKQIDDEGRVSHRSTSPLTPDKPPSPIASPELYEADRLQPVEIEYFSEHVKNMHENRDKRFEREYQTLPNDDTVSATAANKNKSKNRFANIHPYDFSRVKLKEIEGVEGSDYINASYIDGYGKTNAYIAAQGPMPNTIGDFWRMIWEHRLSTIIMLTKVTEGGKRKCEQYWPNNVHDTYNPPETTLVVTFDEIQPFADYEIKKLIVTNPADPQSSPLTVYHYHFLSWPDHDVPQFATALIGFIRRVRSSCSKSTPPLVHCSAGVGRTGTFIVLDSMLERMEDEKTVNVYEFLTNMRRKRIHMVQTQAQYVFIHDALDELITCGDTAILSHNLRMKLGNLGKIVPGKIITGFQHQFELLNSVSRQPTDKDRSDALQHYNNTKNRYQDRLPFNTNRVRLRPNGTPGADYINASFIDGYKKRNAYIAAQAPLQSTVNDFWRMIWEFKSKCIVMLCDLTEAGQESCHHYWPTSLDTAAQYGKLLVTLKSEKEDNEFIIRKFEITEEKTQSAFGNDKQITSFTVTQFQFIGWRELGRPDTSKGVLQMAESVNAVQRSTGNKPVTVVCNDGIGRTGTFICIHAQLERVKTEGVIDVFQFVKSSRISRPNLVSELEYYIFCHQSLADFLDTFDTYANFKDLGAANF